MKASTVAAIAIAIVCAIIGFGLGYWPQAQQRKAAVAQVAELRGEAETLKADLATSNARVRVSDILAQLLVLKDVAGMQNYGKAQELSTAWFDAVRTLGQATPDPAFRQALATSLTFRDPLTIALTRGDPAAMGILASIEEPIRAALGFPAVRIDPALPVPAP